MTKYEELCEASNKAVVEIHGLKQQCMAFGAALAGGLMEYLRCPPDKAHHYNLAGEKPVGPTRSMDDATFVDDGWWHVGMEIDLRPNRPGALVVGNFIIFNLVFRRMKDHYLVRFGRDTKEHVVHPGSPQEFAAAYAHFFGMLKDHFGTEGERFLDPRHGKRMGFL